jgi:hypothetical protein
MVEMIEAQVEGRPIPSSSGAHQRGPVAGGGFVSWEAASIASGHGLTSATSGRDSSSSRTARVVDVST